VGALNSAHIFGTDVPVEEPSTASTTASRSAAIHANRKTAKIAAVSPKSDQVF
jgi:hypothetical protein